MYSRSFRTNRKKRQKEKEKKQRYKKIYEDEVIVLEKKI
jgi:hypothetical protein